MVMIRDNDKQIRYETVHEGNRNNISFVFDGVVYFNSDFMRHHVCIYREPENLVVMKPTAIIVGFYHSHNKQDLRFKVACQRKVDNAFRTTDWNVEMCDVKGLAKTCMETYNLSSQFVEFAYRKGNYGVTIENLQMRL